MTPELEVWIRQWNIDPRAAADLRQRLGVLGSTNVAHTDAETETGVQNRLRVNASKLGIRNWRNNSGAMEEPETGRVIRYGLANESKQQNAVLKSCDVIGIKPVMILPHHVGSVFGQFWGREVKPPNWRYSATEREIAQLNFITLINMLGGDAKFASHEADT